MDIGGNVILPLVFMIGLLVICNNGFCDHLTVDCNIVFPHSGITSAKSVCHMQNLT